MRKILFIIICFSLSIANAQAPQKLNSAEIHEAIKKLNFLGSVLYIAAHPDDENTRLISYLSNHVKANTTYLSITRGDGGQNLIGPELKELLGIIRTQELLAARRIDGGEQYFTRAIDFGYTKTAEEALDFWQKDKVLSDVVWVMRTLKPDIVINRFNNKTPGETHGQHTASAILGEQAFDLAGDPAAFPDQLKHTTVFKPKRLFFNNSPWFYTNQEAFEKDTKGNIFSFDTGVYFPSKGLSNPEIAALSRSEHQSQGFGSTGSRGEQLEHLELLKGDMPGNKNNIFNGIDTSWNRVKGGKKIGEMLSAIEKEYNFRDPSASIPKLLMVYENILALEDSHWKHIKLEEMKEVLASAAGLYLEAVAAAPTATAGEELKVNLEAINRSSFEISLSSVELTPNNTKIIKDQVLKSNTPWRNQAELRIKETAEHTSPYWLKSKGSIGLYAVENPELIGLPEAPKKVKATFNMKFGNITIPFDREVVYKYNDPVKGEVYQPFEIVPPVTGNFAEKVRIFNNSASATVPVTITAGRNDISGKVELKTSGNWKIEPGTNTFDLKGKGESVTLQFHITPPAEQAEAILTPTIHLDGTEYSDEIIRINYDHIPLQTLVMPAEIKLVKLDIQKKGEKIGYIEGAGDVIPQSLRQIGYQVTNVDPSVMTATSLAEFDAVVLGIRAYNTVEELKFSQPALFEYVKNGGTVIVQYNVSRGLVTDQLAPYKLNLSRLRVTEEDAEVRFPNPGHPILNTPNKLTSADFENWVQERGLYFADSWGPEFTPVLSMSDTNESPKEGSLLVAKHGKGHFIYTGLSFFRQFPEGVPGAYRLFANMISIGR